MNVLLHSGGMLDLAAPYAHKILIDDIARGLAGTARFRNQLTRRLCVAEHSLAVAARIRLPWLRLAGLIHDAHEAYTGDLIRPLRQTLVRMDGDALGAWSRLEGLLDSAIAQAVLRAAAPEAEESELLHWRQLLVNQMCGDAVRRADDEACRHEIELFAPGGTWVENPFYPQAESPWPDVARIWADEVRSEAKLWLGQET